MKKRISGVLLFFLFFSLFSFFLLSPSYAAGEIVFDNGTRRFGNGGHNAATYTVSESSIDTATANFNQPFYYDTAQSKWFKLTYADYDLDNAIGIGGDGTNLWNTNGTIVTNNVYNPTVDTSGFTFNSGSTTQGYGTIVTTGNMTIGGQLLQVRNSFTLSPTGAYTRIKTKVSNLSASPLTNVRYWIGTQDDWVGISDNPAKTKGTIGSGSFTPIATTTQSSNALEIESAGTVVYFFTTYPLAKVNTLMNGYGAFNTQIVPLNPTSSAINVPSQDSAYGVFLRLNDIVVGGSEEFTWYYAAGPSSLAASILTELSNGATPSVSPSIVSPLAGQSFNVAPSSISGTGTVGAEIEILNASGSLVGTTVVDGSGNYSFPLSGLSQGSHTYSVFQTVSPYGQSATTNVNFSIDTLAPAAPSILNLPTNFSPLTGTGEIGSTVSIYDNLGTLIGTGVVDGSGNWSLTPSPLPSTGIVNVNLTDVAGNVSNNAPITTENIDIVAPSFSGVTVASSGANPLYARAGDQITFTLALSPADTWESGNNLGFQIGTGTAITTGNFPQSLTPLLSQERTYTIQTGESGPLSITALNFLDQAGNTLTGYTLPYTPSPNIIIDNTSPLLSFSDNIATGPVQSDTFVLSASDTYIDTTSLEYGFSLDSTCNSSDTFGTLFTSGSGITINSEANNGQYICARARDLAGNTTYQSSTNPLFIDITPPSAPSCSSLPSSPLPGQTVTTTCSGVETGASITIPNMSCGTEFAGQIVCTGVVGVGIGQISTSNDVVTLSDIAGNTNTSETTHINLDSTPPNTPSSALDVQTVSDSGISGTDNTTIDTTPNFDALCTEIGSTIRIYSGTGILNSYLCGTPGIISFTLSPALIDGTYTLHYTETDTSGNESGASPGLNLTIDSSSPTSPIISSPTPGQNLSDTTPTINGTGEIGATMVVTGSLGEICTTTVDLSGSWSCTVTPALAEGSNNLSITATDVSGNISSTSNRNIVIDTLLPLAPTLANPTANLITNDATPTINGTGEAGTTFEIRDSSNTLIGTGVVDGSGNYSFTPTTTLPEGTNTLSVTLIDAAGNMSTALVRNFTVDTTAPTPLTLTTPITTSLINDATPTINGTGEAGTTFEIRDGSNALIGTGVVDGSGNYSFTPTSNLSEGTNTLSVTLIDAALNITGPINTTFTLDTLAPATPSSTLDVQTVSDSGISGTDNTTIDTTPSLDVFCNEIGSTIRIYSGTQILTSYTCLVTGINSVTLAPALSDAVYNLHFTETDTAGNESGISPSLAIIIDISAPALVTGTSISSLDDSGTSSTDNLTNNTTPILTGSGEVGSIVSIVVVGTNTYTGLVDSTGNWSIELTSPLTDGVHTLQITQTDSSGNISTPTSAQITIDTVNNTPTISSPIEGDNLLNATENLDVLLSGTAEVLSSLQVTFDDGVHNPITVQVTADSSGNWTLLGQEVNLSSLSQGSITISVRSTDRAGNISLPASSLIIHDSIIPTQIGNTVSTASQTGTLISWQTSEATSSEVVYGLTTATDETTGELDVSPRVTSHNTTLSNLLSCTVYYYKTLSRDSAGNILTSPIQDFKTGGCPGNAQILVDTSTNVVSNTSGGNISLSQSGSSLVDISVPSSYSTAHSVCPNGAYFQLKKIAEVPVITTLGTLPGEQVLDTYELSAYCDPENRVTSFTTPLRVTMHYSPADTVGVFETSLALYRFNTSSNSWEILQNCFVNTTNKTVSCETTKFSTFAIFGKKNDSYTSTGGGGNSGSSKSGGSSNIASVYDATTTSKEKDITSIPKEGTEENKADIQTSLETDISLPQIQREVEVNGVITAYTLTNTYDSCPLIDSIQDTDYAFLQNGVFVDEKESSYADTILKFKSLGIIDGYDDASFRPKNEISRAEFLKVVLLSHCYEYQNQNTTSLIYADVDSTSWQAKVISKSQELGLINGDKNENGVSIFRPNDTISKAEAIKITMRMSRIQAENPVELGYDDVSIDWHMPYVRTGQTLGLFSAEEDNSKFYPEGGVSREYMIHLLDSLIQLY